MKRILILISIIFFVFSCSKIYRESDQNIEYQKNSVIKSDTTTKNALIKSTYANNLQIYKYENDTIFQQLTIKKLTKKELQFSILSENKILKNSKNLEGTAFTLDNSDAEFEQDEEGNAILVNEYIYNGKNCWVSIRLDADSMKFAKLGEADCSVFNKDYSLNTEKFLWKTK